MLTLTSIAFVSKMYELFGRTWDTRSRFRQFIHSSESITVLSIPAKFQHLLPTFVTTEAICVVYLSLILKQNHVVFSQ